MRVLFLAGALPLVLLAGCYGPYHHGAEVHYNAPPLPAGDYYADSGERSGYSWVDGRWTWSGSQWVWNPGHWIEQQPGHVYVQGYWGYSGERYVWTPGLWRPYRRGHVWARGYYHPTHNRWQRGRWVQRRPNHVWKRGRWSRSGARKTWRRGRFVPKKRSIRRRR